MAKVVRVIERNRRAQPIVAAVREDTSPVEVIAHRTPLDWLPVRGRSLRDDREIDLPRGFTLSREALEALDHAE